MLSHTLHRATPCLPASLQASRRASSAGYPSAADASASPSLRGKSLLAAAVLLRARYPATFDTLGAATCATLDNPAAAHPWLCHLLEAHIEPLSLLAPGGVTALVATDAGLLGFVGEHREGVVVPRRVGLGVARRGSLRASGSLRQWQE